MLRDVLASLKITVTLDDQDHPITLKPGDLVRFEEHFGRSLIPAPTQNGDTPEMTFGVTELSYLGWLGVRRLGVFDGDYEAFLDADWDVDIADPEPVSPGKGPSPT